MALDCSRWRRTVAGVLMLLLLPLGLSAQSPAVGEPESEAVVREPPVPLLWRATRDDRALYLLGSFHLLKPDDYPLSADVTTVQANADRLVLELSPAELDSPELATRMVQAATRSDGSWLDSDLPPKLAGQLQAWTRRNAGALKKAQIPPQALQMFHPWFVGLTVSLIEMETYGLDAGIGLDKHIAEAARGEQALPSLGLETGEQQIALLADMPHDAQIQFLADALGQGDGSKSQQDIATLHGLWRAGDVEGLWTQMAVPMRESSPALYARINIERNDAWVPKLEALLADPGYRSTLVVVGALHLLGEDGVVEKLRARGHHVERICSACPSAAP